MRSRPACWRDYRTT